MNEAIRVYSPVALNLTRIVAATDFSDDAANAGRRAAMLASQHGVPLELLHVVPRSSLDAVRDWIRSPADFADRLVEDAGQALEKAAASLGKQASARVAVGNVLDEILASAGDGSILAVGAHGLSPLRDAILGTAAERLVGSCACPILVVRTPAAESYRNVLVAADLLPGTEQALAAAARIAPGSRISAVHAYEVPFEGALQRAGVATDDVEQHRAAAFQGALQEIRALSQSVSGDPAHLLPVVERGHPAQLILEHERGLGADLLVVGKRQRSSAEALLLGSTTRHVLADAACDVLVVPLRA
jgi:nucleotide-binding universal stress UspA family protein